MPWAGNIAKTMTSNGKQLTVTREMLTAVALGNSEFCFPLGKQNSLLPSGPVIILAQYERCLVISHGVWDFYFILRVDVFLGGGRGREVLIFDIYT